jgi:hypothetical protein
VVRNEIELIETGSVAEYPWERSVADRARSTRESSPLHEEALSLYMQAAEIECIEVHEGAEGRRMLLRRGIESNVETYTSPPKPSGFVWPSFEDDD